MAIGEYDLRESIRHCTHDSAQTAVAFLEELTNPGSAHGLKPDTPLYQPRRQPDKVEDFGTERISTWLYPDGTREVRNIAEVDKRNSPCSLTRYNAAGQMIAHFEVAGCGNNIVRNGWAEITLKITLADGSLTKITLAQHWAGGTVSTRTTRNANGETASEDIPHSTAQRDIERYWRGIRR